MSDSPSRRRFLAALGTGVLGIGGAAAGYTGAVTVPHLSPVWERWRSHVDEHYQVTGVAMAIADGRLLLTSGDSVLALDLDSGDTAWSQSITDRLFFGVAVGDGAVYAGSFELASFSLNGEDRWRIQLDESHPLFDNQEKLGSTPVIDGSRLFLNTHTHLIALNATNGSVEWATTLDGWTVEAIETGDDTLFVGLGNPEENHGLVRAVDKDDGSQLWEATVSDQDMDFAVADALYCAVGRIGGLGGTGVVAFDPADGNRRWEYDFVEVNGLTIHGGTVYAVGGVGDYDDPFDPRSPEGSLVSLDATSGEERWRTPAESYGWVAPEVTDDRIYVSSGVTDGPRRIGEGAVLGYTTGGEHLWTYPLGEDNQPATSPVAHDGTIYVGGDKDVVALTERGW